MEIIPNAVSGHSLPSISFIVLSTGIIFWFVAFLILWNTYNADNSWFMEIKKSE